MSLTTVTANLKEQAWDNDFFANYVRANRFARAMGTDENSIIQLKEDLTKKAGDRVHIALITELSGAGQTGNGLLEGNEEVLSQYEMAITVGTIRHAVAITDNEQQFTGIELRDAGKARLKSWAMTKLKNDIIAALGNVAVGVSYASASAAQKNAWTVANSDRVLFGSAKANYNATHATALLTIDNTADKLTASVVSLMKRIAKQAAPLIRPVSIGDDDEENFVMYAGSLPFRDLKNDLKTTNSNADVRGKANVLYRDGDLFYDGVIIKEIPEIGVLTGVGTGAIDAAPVYLCGAQAVGVGWAKRTKTTTDVRDYGFVQGVGVHEMRGVEKVIFNSKDHGIVTGFVAAVADA